MARKRGRTFASLSIRNYRLFFIGQTCNVAGSWMQKLGQAWLILELTGSGVWLGVTIAAQQLPTMLLSPWAGVIADRRPKRTILLWAAGVGVIPASILTVLAFADAVTVPAVLVLALVGGTAEAVEKPARHSFPSEMVPPQNVTNAVTLNNVVQDSGKAIGPALGAAVIAGAGTQYTFLANTLSFLPVLLCLVLMRTDELTSPVGVARAGAQVREGLRYVWRTPYLLGPLALLAVSGLLIYNFQVLLPLLAYNNFDAGAEVAGALLSALGIGSIAGGLAAAGLLSPTPRRIILAASTLGFLFAIAALTPGLHATLVVILLVGACSVVFRTLASSWLQLTADPAMRGRVLSLLVLSVAGTSPLGGPLSGWIAEEFGVRAAFAVGGVGTVLMALAVHGFLKRHPQPEIYWSGVPSSEPSDR